MFDLAAELRSTGLVIIVADAFVFVMPVKLGLKLVTIVSAAFTDAKQKLGDVIVYERDGAGVVVTLIDFEALEHHEV